MSRQILDCHAPASLFKSGDDRLGDLPLVKGSLAALGNSPECPRQAGIAEDLARLRGTTVDGQLQPADGMAQLALHRAVPEISGGGRHGEALLRQPDGWRQDSLHLQAAEALDEVAPTGAGAGDSDGIRVEGGQLAGEAFAAQALQAESSRRRDPSR